MSEVKEEINNQGVDPENTPEGTPSGEPEVNQDDKKDPLDTMSQEELLNEAKRFRGIANRVSKNHGDKDPEPTPPAPDAAPPATDYVTKKDLQDRTEKTAVKELSTVQSTDSDDVKAMKTAFAENLEDIKGYYTNRSGREEPEQIAKDLRHAYLLWADENGQAANPAAIAAMPAIKPSGGPAPKAPKDPAEGDSRFKMPSNDPKNWY